MGEEVSLKPVKDLLGLEFHIPDYQRGYRWEKQQVEELLNDLLEFHKSIHANPDSEEIYCLQPLVVQSIQGNDRRYTVIDGQQRLTTIKILLACLGEIDTYSVTYKTRKGSENFLNHLNDNEDSDSWRKNADFFHMHQANLIIQQWSRNYSSDTLKAFLETIKERVQFVWYRVDDTSGENEAIQVFKRLNIGRIGLTESELIKALFLNSNNFEEERGAEDELLTKLEIATEWDKIEYRLQDDRFWLFFHSPDYNRPTRIDYILELLHEIETDGEREGNGSVHPVFQYFYSGFMVARDKHNKYKYMCEQWEKIMRIYQILEEWYNDETLYHYIGFLFALPGKANLIDLIRSFEEAGSKESFIAELKKRIKRAIKINNRPFDFDMEYEGEGKPAKGNCKPALLLHNVQTVLNQNKSISEEKKYGMPDFVRFPFHLFKKEHWDVEHIRPNTPEDFEGDRKKLARKKYVFVLDQCQDESIKKIVKVYNDDLSKGTKEADAFIKLWNNLNGENDKELPEKDKNKIWNYTLLDASTNREYGNSCFLIKRSYVLKKEKGIKPVLKTDDSGNITSGEVKEAAFVPVCTRNVFSKAYAAYPDDLRTWTKKDAEYYREDMEKTLAQFL